MPTPRDDRADVFPATSPVPNIARAVRPPNRAVYLIALSSRYEPDVGAPPPHPPAPPPPPHPPRAGAPPHPAWCLGSLAPAGTRLTCPPPRQPRPPGRAGGGGPTS